MAYIATDLDAYDDAQGVAGVVSFGPHGLQQVLGGLSLMWRWCWRNKTDRVTSEQVAGFFCYPAADLRGALAAFGFLELGPESHRVRGVARYLHLSAARSAAGKVRAANAKRGEKGRLESSTPPAHAGQPASTPPPTDQPLQRRATSDERRATKSLRAANAPASPKESDWRMKPTIDALCSAYLKVRGVKYPFDGGKEAKCVERLLARAPPETLLPAWSRALAEGGYPKVATLLEFERSLPHFLGTAPDAGRAVSGHQARRFGADPNQGIITREEREETAAEIEEANRRSEEFING